MKKAIATVALLVILSGPMMLCAAEDKEYYVDNLYITSYYTVEVYSNNRRIAFLYAGARAKVLKSAKYWLYVEFWDGRRMITGWIRR